MSAFEVSFVGSVVVEADDAEQAEFFAIDDLGAVEEIKVTEVKELNG